MPAARYDGQSQWYEAYTSGETFAAARASAVRLLGDGPGRCLDLGCGTGSAIPALLDAAWSVVGVDVSRDQLAAASDRVGDRARLVHADAHALPFADGEFDAVVSVLTHTDFDDPPAAFAEARRVLRGGGAFVHLGVHPCFGSPFVDRASPGAPTLRPGYRDAGWHRLPPDPTATGIRSRVGVNHLTLAGFLNAVVRGGFTLERVEEPGEEDPPLFLAVRAVRN